MKKVSILFMTMNRFEYTKQTLETNLKNHGADVEIELLWCDNGSTENELLAYMKKQKPYYSRLNKVNEGCAKAFNQLYLRATGDYIVLMGNDVLMPKDWLNEMIKYADHVPNSGLIGVECTAGKPDLISKFGCYAHFVDKKVDKVFGVTLLKRRVIEEIGLFCEKFDVYGLEDSDINCRVNLAGFNSLYVPNMKSKHIGDDVGTETDYRKMKNESMHKNWLFMKERIAAYPSSNLKEPLPEMREPLE